MTLLFNYPSVVKKIDTIQLVRYFIGGIVIYCCFKCRSGDKIVQQILGVLQK